MSYMLRGAAAIDGQLVVPGWTVPVYPRRLGQWEMVGSVAAASGASYGTMLWGESDVSRFFDTVYGQVIVTALNLIGDIWGIPLGSIVQGLAEMFGGLFGGGKSHEQREAEELARTVGNLKLYVAELQRQTTFTNLYNSMIRWSTKYVGGSCPGPTSRDAGAVPQCIAIQVRPMLYAPPDVQPVTLHGLGAGVPGGTRTAANAYGFMGLLPGTDLRTLPLSQWPWVQIGFTGRPSAWYPTTTETGFFRALIADPVQRFRVGIQQGVAQSKLAPLNKQIADVIRGSVAKIIQRDYGPAIQQAIALAEASVSGTIPTPQQTAAAVNAGVLPPHVDVALANGIAQARIVPGMVPSSQQLAIAMAPAGAVSPANQSWWPLAAAAAGVYFLGGS